MSPYRESRMRATRFAAFVAPLFPLLVFPPRAAAQTTGADVPAMAPASSPPGGGIAVVVASGSVWRHSPLLVAVTGTVPTPELRDAVMRLVEREVSRRQPSARAEDRLVVDPLMGKHVA